MSKCLTVVAFALLVLSGAMGLRNIAVTHAATSASSSFTMQGRPFPPPGPGRMQGRPFPPPGPGR
jgi:hypothetical protein